MDLNEYKNAYHIDIATQIENRWKNDTCLGIVKENQKYSIKIKGKDKEKIKHRYVIEDNSKSSKKHNKRIVAIIYSYLFYKALCEFKEANPLVLCRDVRPEKFVTHYIQKICNFFNNKELLNRKIQFRKREDKRMEKLPKSLAGKYIRKVYQGKIKPNKILEESEINELIDIIGKII